MEKLLNFLSVFFGWLIWRKTGSMFLAVLASIFLFPFIGPIIKGLFGLIVILIEEFILLFIPTQKVHLFTPRGADSDGKGLRVFIGVKDFSKQQPELPIPPNDAESILAAAKQMLGSNKNFAYLNTYIGEHDLPVEVYIATYRNGLYFNKASKAWHAATDTKLFKKQTSGENFFSCDLKAADGKTEYAEAVFLFDGNIELSKEPAQAPAIQQKSSDTPNP